MLTSWTAASSNAPALTESFSGSNNLPTFTSIYNCHIRLRHFYVTHQTRLFFFPPLLTIGYTLKSHRTFRAVCWRRFPVGNAVLITHGLYSQPQITHRPCKQTVSVAAGFFFFFFQPIQVTVLLGELPRTSVRRWCGGSPGASEPHTHQSHSKGKRLLLLYPLQMMSSPFAPKHLSSSPEIKHRVRPLQVDSLSAAAALIQLSACVFSLFLIATIAYDRRHLRGNTAVT